MQNWFKVKQNNEGDKTVWRKVLVTLAGDISCCLNVVFQKDGRERERFWPCSSLLRFFPLKEK